MPARHRTVEVAAGQIGSTIDSTSSSSSLPAGPALVAIACSERSTAASNWEPSGERGIVPFGTELYVGLWDRNGQRLVRLAAR